MCFNQFDMKHIFTFIALAFIFTSCQKKETTYWCQTTASFGAAELATLTMTTKEKDKYVKDHTVEIDGNTSTIIDGERHTSCDPIK